MILINLKTGEELEATIDPLVEDDLKQIKESKQFLFDWQKEFDEVLEVYKIYLVDEGKIVGLLSLVDVPHEIRIHIQLIEVAIENTGKNKLIANVAGTLIAFACEKAFKNGYGGFVSLIPRTKLIEHYIVRYGFSQFGRMLAIEGQKAKLLLHKYLGYE